MCWPWSSSGRIGLDGVGNNSCLLGLAGHLVLLGIPCPVGGVGLVCLVCRVGLAGLVGLVCPAVLVCIICLDRIQCKVLCGHCLHRACGR